MRRNSTPAAGQGPSGEAFDPCCRRCPRLAAHLDAVRRDYPGYHAAPVAPFGDPVPRLLVVGLAPGMHGANRTGRPFTGDHAGTLLYRMLHEFGHADRAESVAADDGLRLPGCRITNAVKCLPPQNKPTPAEVAACNGYLAVELSRQPAGAVVLALGAVAHGAVLRALGHRPAQAPFRHGALHSLDGERWLADSYHCSRYNTQTGRLTEAMLREVFRSIASLLS